MGFYTWGGFAVACVGLQEPWDVRTSPEAVSDESVMRFAAQVKKAHELQGEGSCQKKGVGCEVITNSALEKDESNLETARLQ